MINVRSRNGVLQYIEESISNKNVMPHILYEQFGLPASPFEELESDIGENERIIALGKYCF